MKTIQMGVVATAMVFGSGVANAEVVNVKYRGPVPLDSFTCPPLKPSSFVKRICYDASHSYLIVRLKSTYYHYCEVDAGTVAMWQVAPSLGRFYNQKIKGGVFGCQNGVAPEY